jgi:hypothetical protein
MASGTKQNRLGSRGISRSKYRVIIHKPCAGKKNLRRYDTVYEGGKVAHGALSPLQTLGGQGRPRVVGII